MPIHLVIYGGGGLFFDVERFMRLDSYDLKILRILQSNGRITKSSLAEAINLSISPCWERVKRLEKAGFKAEEVQVFAHGNRGTRHTIWIAEKLKG